MRVKNRQTEIPWQSTSTIELLLLQRTHVWFWVIFCTCTLAIFPNGMNTSMVPLWKFKSVGKINLHPWCVWQAGRKKQYQLAKVEKQSPRYYGLGKCDKQSSDYCRAATLVSCQNLLETPPETERRVVLEQHLGEGRSIFPRDSAVTNVHSWIHRSSGA